MLLTEQTHKVQNGAMGRLKRAHSELEERVDGLALLLTKAVAQLENYEAQYQRRETELEFLYQRVRNLLAKAGADAKSGAKVNGPTGSITAEELNEAIRTGGIVPPWPG